MILDSQDASTLWTTEAKHDLSPWLRWGLVKYRILRKNCKEIGKWHDALRAVLNSGKHAEPGARHASGERGQWFEPGVRNERAAWCGQLCFAALLLFRRWLSVGRQIDLA